jgi:hypothetical protein
VVKGLNDEKPNQNSYFLFQDYELVVTTVTTNALENVNNCMNTNIYSYLDTSGGQSSNPYLNVVHFLNTRAD